MSAHGCGRECGRGCGCGYIASPAEVWRLLASARFCASVVLAPGLMVLLFAEPTVKLVGIIHIGCVHLPATDEVESEGVEQHHGPHSPPSPPPPNPPGMPRVNEATRGCRETEK